MKSIIKLFRPYYRAHYGWVIGFVIIVILHKITSLASPIILQNLVDSYTIPSLKSGFRQNGICFITINLLFIMLLVSRNLLENKIAIDATTQLKLRLLEKIPHLRSTDLEKFSLGNFLQLVNDDTENISSLVINDFTVFLTNIFYTAFIILYLIKTNFSLSISVLFVFPVFLVASKIFIPKLQKRRTGVIESEQKLSNIVEETFDGSSEIKIFNGYQIIGKKGHRVLDELQQQVKHFVNLDTIYDYLLTTGLLNLGNVFVYVMGGYLVLQGKITIGNITLFAIYFSHLWNCVEFFQTFFKDYNVKLISVHRIENVFSLTDEDIENDSLDERIVLAEIRRIRLSHVSFSYDQEKNILQDIDLRVERPGKVGILGNNGCGKTTLAKLLVGLLEPTKGDVLYNDTLHTKIKKSDIREKVILFSAEPFIFEGSFQDNFVNSTAIPDDALKAKYEKISLSGKNLSSGEKKYLQYLRGTSRNPDIYIFDEPLNYIDETKKDDFLEYIRKETLNKIVIIISHDYSILQECDSIYRLEQGVLVNIKKSPTNYS